MAYLTGAERERARLALARAIQGEAGGEGTEGMLAVGNNIMNRAAQDEAGFQGYGPNPADQAYAGGPQLGAGVHQYSTFNAPGPPPVGHYGNTAWRHPTTAAFQAADQLLAGSVPDTTMGSNYYHRADNAGVGPSAQARLRASERAGLAGPQLGAHRFYQGTDTTPAERARIRDRFAYPESITYNPAMSAAQAAIDAAPAPQAPQTAAERMWNGIRAVVGAPVTQAMRLGNVGIEGLSSVARRSAAAQNPQVDQPIAVPAAEPAAMGPFVQPAHPASRRDPGMITSYSLGAPAVAPAFPSGAPTTTGPVAAAAAARPTTAARIAALIGRAPGPMAGPELAAALSNQPAAPWDSPVQPTLPSVPLPAARAPAAPVSAPIAEMGGPELAAARATAARAAAPAPPAISLSPGMAAPVTLPMGMRAPDALVGANVGSLSDQGGIVPGAGVSPLSTFAARNAPTGPAAATLNPRLSAAPRAPAAGEPGVPTPPPRPSYLSRVATVTPPTAPGAAASAAPPEQPTTAYTRAPGYAAPAGGGFFASLGNMLSSALRPQNPLAPYAFGGGSSQTLGGGDPHRAL